MRFEGLHLVVNFGTGQLPVVFGNGHGGSIIRAYVDRLQQPAIGLAFVHLVRKSSPGSPGESVLRQTDQEAMTIRCLSP
jgi:hypothetical protein